MTIEFLGTGTSMGVPVIGCSCDTCQSLDPRDKRLRTSALISDGSTNILIDCGPDFRLQMLRADSPKIDAVLLTHIHYDHAGGLDDLRPYCLIRKSPFPIFCQKDVADAVKRNLPYCFAENKYPGAPNIALEIIAPFSPFKIGSFDVLPVPVLHGKLPILGFRFGPLAYITDASSIPPETFDALRGVDTLVINALRHKPHPSHFSLNETLDAIERINPRQSFLVHMADQMGPHASVSLPDGVFLAYDGLRITV